ncbi:hypothetical protein H2201_003534 [Coniosporium apollinis]|uniref:C2H2-type domain-containing protein n=1 Tax=Coniosporium apollinis TaxID=61459 RepID=A0ABQ9NVD3_9PEZI|nr:hypothetical protein H2201_003534 [Coniosporium apollinis]
MSDTAGPTITTSDGGAVLSVEWGINFGETLTFDAFDTVNPYLTPYSSSMAEFPSSMPGSMKNTLVTDPASLWGFPTFNASVPARPRSSPSTFSCPRVDEFQWMSNPLGIPDANLQPAVTTTTTWHSLKAPSPRLHSRTHLEIAAPQPRRVYAPIAPSPAGPPRTNELKRSRDEEETTEAESKRQRRSASIALSDLGDEDRLLLKLKDEENLRWKDIASRFQTELGKTYQVPTLQMRLKRLRERLRVWTEVDTVALRAAHEYWRQHKFDIISAKMNEFGSHEKWTAKQCASKWQELHPVSPPFTAFEDVPGPSHAMSPLEGSGSGFGFIPQAEYRQLKEDTSRHQQLKPDEEIERLPASKHPTRLCEEETEEPPIFYQSSMDSLVLYTGYTTPSKSPNMPLSAYSTCIECNHPFADLNARKTHILETGHAGCTYCGEYTGIGNLYNHLAEYHPREDWNDHAAAWADIHAKKRAAERERVKKEGEEGGEKKP